jgi:hypothetical protein
LFEDASEVAGAQYAVAIRKIDGGPPVQLGQGSAGGLSPDGKWAISILPGGAGRLTLLPVGPGQPRTIPTPGLEIKNGTARFLADGKHIFFNANEPGHGVRCYLVGLDGEKPVPITTEGMVGASISPNGRSLLVNDNGVVEVYPVGGGAPHVIPNLEKNFAPLQWADDVSAIGFVVGQLPTQVYKVNLTTGEKVLLKELRPETTTGVVGIAPVVANREGTRFAYSYYQLFSVLYLVSGAR